MGCDSETDTPAEWISSGGVILFMILTIQLFWGLAYVSDHYFAESLKIFCEKFELSDGVAGAFIMAIGSSFGDFVISILALFIFHSTVGLGTILGSAIFNHLVISGVCAKYAKHGVLKVNPDNFTKDCISYLLSLCALMVVFNRASFEKNNWDECLSITWLESSLLCLCYGSYVAYTLHFPTKRNDEILTTPILSEDDRWEKKEQKEKDMNHETTDTPEGKREIESFDVGRDSLIISDQSTSMEVAAIYSQISFNYLVYPLKFVIDWSMPDPSKPENADRYIYIMALSIAWISMLVEAVLECLTTIGSVVGISESLMGMTISAMGASLPTLVASMSVAKAGKGDMAISNALGANIFCGLFGLGFPWLLYTIAGNNYDGIQDDGILPILLLLSVIIVAYYCLIAYFNFELRAWMGNIFLGGYVFVMLMCIAVLN